MQIHFPFYSEVVHLHLCFGRTHRAASEFKRPKVKLERVAMAAAQLARAGGGGGGDRRVFAPWESACATRRFRSTPAHAPRAMNATATGAREKMTRQSCNSKWSVESPGRKLGLARVHTRAHVLRRRERFVSLETGEPRSLFVKQRASRGGHFRCMRECMHVVRQAAPLWPSSSSSQGRG